jgi:hypothetical protein
MAFEYKRQFPKGEKTNGHGAGTHDSAANGTATGTADIAQLDERVLRYVPSPPAPRDFGREQADQRAETQSLKSLRLRQHLDCEPPWDIQRARASFDNPVSPHEPWPDRFDVWPSDMAGYWPCPVCETALVPVDRTPMKLFRCVTCDTETFVHVKAPVVDCPRHGRHEIELPWRRNDMKWTYLGTEPSEH